MDETSETYVKDYVSNLNAERKPPETMHDTVTSGTPLTSSLRFWRGFSWGVVVTVAIVAIVGAL